VSNLNWICTSSHEFQKDKNANMNIGKKLSSKLIKQITLGKI